MVYAPSGMIDINSDFLRAYSRVLAGDRVGYLFFFFQAEDGIRDLIVTGVQTCALPIYFAMGRKQDTAVPRPGSLVTCMAPLCSSMMRWQRASPRPNPRSLVVKKGVKTLSRDRKSVV